MEGRLPAGPFDRDGSLMIPPHMLEELHWCTPKWYYSIKEIEEQSPSRKDGVSLKKEMVLRSLYCSFLQELGMKLKLPQVTIATAIMLCHRFYLRQSHAKSEWQTIASVSMFLACKVEETPRLLKDVTVMAYETMYKKDPAVALKIKHKDVYDKQKELIVIGERLLLATIGFDLNLQHPYKPLVAALKTLDISHNELAKVAWNFVNDWLRTTLCLEYKPHYVAAGSMYLAAKFQNVKLPSEKGKIWWMEFDVTPQGVEEVIQRMLTLLEQSNNPLMIFSREKVTKAPVVKKAPSGSPQSCVLNGSNSTSGPRSAVDVKPGDVRSCESTDAHLRKSKNGTNKEICVVRKEELSQCQTSDCGSAHSVIEDGNRSDESEDKPGIVRESVGTSCMEVSDGNDGQVQVRMVVESNQTASSCKVVSESDQGEVLARMVVESNQTANCSMAVSAGNDPGEVQASMMVESNQSANCKVLSDSDQGKVEARTKMESSQPASSKNVSDSDVGELQARITAEASQTASCKAVSDSDWGEVQARVAAAEVKRTASCKVVSDRDQGVVPTRMMVESSQTASYKIVSNSDQVEVQTAMAIESNETAGYQIASESGQGEVQATMVVESNQTETYKAGSIDGGLIKIDKDRIRETLKKRKLNKIANKKVVTAKQDDGEDADSWIVRELENGIDMQYASAPKKQRL